MERNQVTSQSSDCMSIVINFFLQNKIGTAATYKVTSIYAQNRWGPSGKWIKGNGHNYGRRKA